MSAPLLGTLTLPQFKPRKHIRMNVTEETRNQTNNKKVLSSYSEMLQRVFNMIHNKNPESDSRAKRIALPQLVISKKAKKTIFENFTTICSIMDRPQEHLKQYICTEQSTVSSINEKGQLVIAGRLQQSQIERLILNYIKQYVQCPVCGSMETKLEKYNRIQFIVCNQCTAQTAVQQIKGGFVANTTKRSKR